MQVSVTGTVHCKGVEVEEKRGKETAAKVGEREAGGRPVLSATWRASHLAALCRDLAPEAEA